LLQKHCATVDSAVAKAYPGLQNAGGLAAFSLDDVRTAFGENYRLIFARSAIPAVFLDVADAKRLGYGAATAIIGVERLRQKARLLKIRPSPPSL
jgi:hypothetical protein